MIAKGEFKQCVANTYIFFIIIYKFHYKQELYLVILLLIDKYLEVSPYSAIPLLSSVIHL